MHINKKLILTFVSSFFLMNCKTNNKSEVQSVATQAPNIANDYGPSANMEVLQNNVVDHSIRTDKDLLIRPTSTSVDYKTELSCKENNGIIEESYRITNILNANQNNGQGRWNKMKRNNCERMGFPYSFKEPGYYKIELKLTDNRSNIAQSSMVLSVSSQSTETVTDGFSIKSDSLNGDLNELIYLEADGCPSYGKISWNDKESSKTSKLGISFSESGSYSIQATCVLPGAQDFVSSATIIIH